MPLDIRGRGKYTGTGWQSLFGALIKGPGAPGLDFETWESTALNEPAAPSFAFFPAKGGNHKSRW